MRFAKMGVRFAGSEDIVTHFDMTYNYWADNTWYCPDGSYVYGTSGTWVAQLSAEVGMIYFYSSDGRSIALAEGFDVCDRVGYPFNETVQKISSRITFVRRPALLFGQSCMWKMLEI